MRGNVVDATKARLVRAAPALVGAAVGALLIGVVMPSVVEGDEVASGDRTSVLTDEGRGEATGDGTGGSGGEGGDTSDGIAVPTQDGADAGDGTSTGTSPGSAAPGGAGATGAGAGSGGGTSGQSEPGGSSAPASGPRTATDRGVTADTIRVGGLLLDVATVGRLGVGVAIDPNQQQAAFQAFFDEINARGGIHGRMIEGHYEAYDVTSTDDQIRACRSLTQDKKVFAVLGGFNTVVPNLCVVQENQTPLIANANNFPDWVFQRAEGRLVTLYARSGRMMDATVAELERLGLADKPIGIMTDGLNDPKSQVMAQLDERLAQRGHEVVYKGELSADIPTASSQIPVEVQKARSAGVEVMIFLSSNAVYGTTFVQQAEDQGFRPQYVNTDWSSNNGDSTNQNMPAGYEGAIAITASVGLGNKKPPPQEPPQAARCREAYDEHSGRKLAPKGTTEYGLSINFCDTVRVFEALAVAAGPSLTRGGLVGAVPNMGPFEAAAYGPGSFGAGKADYADQVRTGVWKADCKCWHLWESFHRPGG